MTLNVFILLLLFVPGISLAQDESAPIATPEDAKEIPVEPAVSEDEKLLNELNAAKARQAETALKIEQAKDDLSNVASGTLSDLQNSGNLSLETFKSMDDKTLTFLRDKLKESNMSSVPAERVRAAILEKTNGNSLGPIFKRYPLMLDICVDILRDPEAETHGFYLWWSR
jgi:hypothetical protein